MRVEFVCLFSKKKSYTPVNKGQACSGLVQPLSSLGILVVWFARSLWISDRCCWHGIDWLWSEVRRKESRFQILRRWGAVGCTTDDRRSLIILHLLWNIAATEMNLCGNSTNVGQLMSTPRKIKTAAIFFRTSPYVLPLLYVCTYVQGHTVHQRDYVAVGKS